MEELWKVFVGASGDGLSLNTNFMDTWQGSIRIFRNNLGVLLELTIKFFSKKSNKLITS